MAGPALLAVLLAAPGPAALEITAIEELWAACPLGTPVRIDP